MSATMEAGTTGTHAVQVLEYGKYCVTPDGPIEHKAEYCVLGHSPDFPPELIPRCSPSHSGLASSFMEMDNLGLLDANPWGTVIWPTRIDSRNYYLAYRVGRRSEGGPRNYFVGRYLCSPIPTNPWFLYRAMTKLTGITREVSKKIAPIRLPSAESIQPDASETAFAQRAMNGMVWHRMPVFAVMRDEAEFFRLCGTMWEKMNASQRVLFSCAWNVGPSIGSRLVVSFGPVIPQKAAKLDFRQAPKSLAPLAAKSQSALDLYPNLYPLLRDFGNQPAPDPSRGFMDQRFLGVFCGGRPEDAVIEWMPEILTKPNLYSGHYNTLISSLIKFDPVLQSALYHHLEEKKVIANHEAMARFRGIEKACKQHNASWGDVAEAATVRLALRLGRALETKNTGSLLAEMSIEDLARTDGPPFSEPLREAMSNLALDQQMEILSRLLAAKIHPEWLWKWLDTNISFVVGRLLRSDDSEKLAQLDEVVTNSPLLNLAKLILKQPVAPIWAKAQELKMRLIPDDRKLVGQSLHWKGMRGHDFDLNWLELFREDLPPSLLSHLLSKWKSKHDQVRTEIKKEFEAADSNQSSFLKIFSNLCDQGEVPIELSDKIWVDLASIASSTVADWAKGWNRPSGDRVRLLLASQNDRHPDSAVWALLAAAQHPGMLDTLAPEDAEKIIKAIQRVATDPAFAGELAELILRWPEWTPLNSWREENELRVMAMLLRSESQTEQVEERFGSICSRFLRPLWNALLAFSPLPEGMEKRPQRTDFDVHTAEGFARYIERQWQGYEKAAWKEVIKWAQWSGSDGYEEPSLRILAGLNCKESEFMRRPDWRVLKLAEKEQLKDCPVLTLLRSALLGVWPDAPPPPADMREATWKIREDASLAGEVEGRYDDLWRSEIESWKRLFVLCVAPKRTYAIFSQDLAAFHVQDELLKVAIETRKLALETEWQSPQTKAEGEELIKRLEVAAAFAQQYLYGQGNWSEEFAATDLIGAFQNVPIRFYSADRLSSVLRFYFPGLSKHVRSVAAVKFIKTFLEGYRDSKCFLQALHMVDQGFANPFVWEDSFVKDSVEHHFGGNAKGMKVEWKQAPQSFVNKLKKTIEVDVDLKDVLQQIIENRNRY